MGPQKAIHAVGNLILRLCYHILVSGIKYEEREKEDYEKILQNGVKIDFGHESVEMV